MRAKLHKKEMISYCDPTDSINKVKVFSVGIVELLENDTDEISIINNWFKKGQFILVVLSLKQYVELELNSEIEVNHYNGPIMRSTCPYIFPNSNYSNHI